mmetsp:Transcript_38863/g.109825  ORF Transcript_38863/g.109825 Transcript_38863/m.109825 type:complete len:200 (+) Transcript_38863:19-618(+)
MYSNTKASKNTQENALSSLRPRLAHYPAGHTRQPRGHRLPGTAGAVPSHHRREGVALFVELAALDPEAFVLRGQALVEALHRDAQVVGVGRVGLATQLRAPVVHDAPAPEQAPYGHLVDPHDDGRDGGDKHDDLPAQVLLRHRGERDAAREDADAERVLAPRGGQEPLAAAEEAIHVAVAGALVQHVVEPHRQQNTEDV